MHKPPAVQCHLAIDVIVPRPFHMETHHMIILLPGMDRSELALVMALITPPLQPEKPSFVCSSNAMLTVCSTARCQGSCELR